MYSRPSSIWGNTGVLPSISATRATSSMITPATCCHVIGWLVSAAIRRLVPRPGLGIQRLGLQDAHEVVDVVAGEVRSKVTSGLREGRVVRDHGQPAERQALRHRQAPALVAGGVDREVGMRVEGGQVGVRHAARQHADLAVQATGADVLVQEVVRMPPESTDADEVGHLLGPTRLDQPLPGREGQGVVLARFDGADEERDTAAATAARWCRTAPAPGRTAAR